MKRLLLTGFEPFLDFKVNPTEEISCELDGKVIGEFQVYGRVLPVEFSKTAGDAIKHFEDVQPDVVVMLGLAGGRSKITPERIAINCSDGAADNNGVALKDALIEAKGPDGYFTTLPIRKIINSLQQKGFPAQISNSAGTYLCNYAMYTILHHIKTANKNAIAGFIHIPASHELAIEQGQIPSWSQQDLQESVEIIIHSLD